MRMFECDDWTEAPNGILSFYRDLDPIEHEHIAPCCTLGEDAYVAIYEYPKREGDMPIYIRTSP